jgi:hypothetical protein
MLRATPVARAQRLLCGSPSTGLRRFAGGGSSRLGPLGSHRLARGRSPRWRAAPPCSRSRLSRQRRACGRAFRFASQCRSRRASARRRWPSASASRGARRILRALARPRLGTARRRWKLHAGSTRLREADGNSLLRRSRTMLAFANVPDLFVDELASLRRWCLTSAFGLAGAFNRLLLRHDLHHLCVGLPHHFRSCMIDTCHHYASSAPRTHDAASQRRRVGLAVRARTSSLAKRRPTRMSPLLVRVGIFGCVGNEVDDQRVVRFFGGP